jgi:membrane protease YdiL (CAAX protease family)
MAREAGERGWRAIPADYDGLIPMLFWTKKTTPRGLLALLLLAAAAQALSAASDVRLALRPTPAALGMGVAAWLAILVSDGVIHAVLSCWGGTAYRRAGVEFREYFRGMTPVACVTGGLVAGLGEEPLYRGVLLPLLSSLSPGLGLLVTAVLFGAAHYVRPSLRLFAVWAAWQGFLLGVAFFFTGSLTAVMLAHFLHDTTAFYAIAHLSRRDSEN